MGEQKLELSNTTDDMLSKDKKGRATLGLETINNEVINLLDINTRENNKLEKIGDYILNEDKNYITIVEDISTENTSSVCNAGTTIATFVASSRNTPIITKHKLEDFQKVLDKNKELQYKLDIGKFDEIVELGFLEKNENIENISEMFNKQIEDGNSYFCSTALISNKLIFPQNKMKEEQEKEFLSNSEFDKDIYDSLFKNENERLKVFNKGLEYSKSSYRGKNIKGWSLLVASAKTNEEKSKGFSQIKEEIDNKYIDMSANIYIPLAILGTEEQKKEIYESSKQTNEESKYWSISGGALLSMAISTNSKQEKSKIFNISRERIKENDFDYRYTYIDILVLAITADSKEEKSYINNILYKYINIENGYNNHLIRWGNIAMGILKSDDKEKAIKGMASLFDGGGNGFTFTWA